MNKNTFSLEINPLITRIKAYKSPVLTIIKVENNTSKDIILTVSPRFFKQSEENNGQINFTNPSNEREKNFLSRIKIINEGKEVKNLKLTPYEKRNLEVKIDLENDLKSDDYYFSLIFTSQSLPGASRTQTQVQGAVASNILLSVIPSDTKAPEVKIHTPIFLTHGPVPFKILLQNNSKTLMEASGDIYVTNLFGKEIAKIPLPKRYILANSKRYLNSENTNISKDILILQDYSKTAVWNENFLFGFYSAKVEIRSDQSEKVVSAKTNFIGLPIFVIVTITLLVFILAGLYLRVKRKI